MFEKLKSFKHRNKLVGTAVLALGLAGGNVGYNAYVNQQRIVNAMNSTESLAAEMVKNKLADKELVITKGFLPGQKITYYASEIGEQGLQKKMDEAKDLGLTFKVDYALKKN